MRFHRVEQTSNPKSGTLASLGRTVWSNENGSCVIALGKPGLHAIDWVNVAISSSNKTMKVFNTQEVSVHLNGQRSHGISCKSDGVMAFVVEEIMIIAANRARKQKWKDVRSSIFWFFKAMSPIATLQNFQAYKAKKQGKA